MNAEPTTPLPDSAETLPLPDASAPADGTTAFSADAELPASAPLPRTRWAAIVWGVCFAGIAWAGIWMLGSADRRDGVADAFASLTPGTITALVLLTIGVLVLITGLVGLIRHAQRRLTTRV
ncbi:hypothetical protein [Microbacterium suwonense]|uniref:DUF1206 domain-containing protein n=1 Tax=Microbacterium suwonense TaxID=683047 RepID=A0ABM8FXR3_9MICO|nr:hypothetical protein [Microbacterium suwonense]BDZ40534.1 hypothetical protein GCM10025863_31480 [Microbacterium suwonense]